MDVKRSVQTRRFGALVASFTLTVGLVLAVAASPADAAPKVRANPTTDLVDRQSIRVAGQGFTPAASIAVLTCQAGALTQDDCDLSHLVLTTSDGTGAFTVHYEVRRVIETVSGGVRDCGKPSTPCIVVGANVNDVTEATGVAIAFDPDVPPIPPLQAIFTVSGIGIANADGSATVTGTLRCSRDASGSLFVSLHQSVPGRPEGSADAPVICGPSPTAWGLTVQTFSAPFQPGQAVGDFSVFVSDPDDTAVADAHVRVSLVSG